MSQISFKGILEEPFNEEFEILNLSDFRKQLCDFLL